MIRQCSIAALCGIVVGLRLGTPAAALSNRELLDILATNTPVLQSAQFERLVLDSLVRAVDPRGVLTTPADATARTDGATVNKVELWPEEIGYLKLDGLYDSGTNALVEALLTLSTGAVSGLLLDLRGAGGAGLGATDVLLSTLIHGTNPLYSVHNRTGAIVATHRPINASPHLEKPVIILANQQTREAPELVCAVSKGAPRTLLVGGPTSGDLNLRGVLSISETQALYVTTHRLIPNAPACPAPDQAVVPDIAFTNLLSTLYSIPSADHEPGSRPPSAKARQDIELINKVMSDPELARATDILLGLRALAQAKLHRPADAPTQSSPKDNSTPLAERPDAPLE